MKKHLSWGDVVGCIASDADIAIAEAEAAYKIAKNIPWSGERLEVFFIELLLKALPNFFGVSSGHIIARIDNSLEPVVSPQVDIIIYDKTVGHNLSPFGSKKGYGNFIPKEAVVAIFEVKKTLYSGSRHNSLKNTCAQLKAITDMVQIKPCQPGSYLLGGTHFVGGKGITISGGRLRNPMLGILVGKFDVSLAKGLKKIVQKQKTDIIDCCKILEPNRLDIVFSMDGWLLALRDGKGWLIDNKRSAQMIYGLMDPTQERNKVIGMGINIICTFLQNVCGKSPNMSDYWTWGYPKI